MIEKADIIIIGAGSAGCVLAAELSKEETLSIVLIEAGPKDTSPFIDMPRGLAKLMVPGNPHVYAYDVDKGGNHGSDLWLKGRAIGGSSSINGMVYVRGFPSDYNRWQDAGCEGWGWNVMLPHLRAIEDHELGENESRGVGGPLKISAHQASGASKNLGDALLAAATGLGVPAVQDTNEHPDGSMGYQPRNIWRGRRQSASKAFLRSAISRKNLHVCSETQVLQILFDGKTAKGVRVLTRDGEKTIQAKREIIISAGAIESPKLLQLSGIGPAPLLRDLGIPIIHDSPQVGQNLREHLYLQCKFRCSTGSLNQEFRGLRLLGNILRYYLAGRGPMTHAAQEMIGYIRSKEGLSRPDCQIGVGFYSMGHTEKGLELDDEPGFTIGGYHMHPQSQGSVQITSSDPNASPRIVANFLQHPEDRAASIGMVRFIRKLVEHPSLSSLVTEEVSPGPQVVTDEDIHHCFMAKGGTAFHVSGTCRMGSDDKAVVDARTRVRGVDRLRVVDTSIFPELPSGNTNAPAMAVARNAAGMILRDIRSKPRSSVE